jgi:hypothetical protein
MAVRAGAPKPDISSVDALTRALLNAKSIAYSTSGSGIYLSTELFQRLGIAEQGSIATCTCKEQVKNRRLGLLLIASPFFTWASATEKELC